MSQPTNGNQAQADSQSTDCSFLDTALPDDAFLRSIESRLDALQSVREEEEQSRRKREEDERVRREQERREALEGRYRDLREKQMRLEAARDRARELAQEDLLAQIEPALTQVSEALKAVETELGYNPERRRLEEEAQKAREESKQTEETMVRVRANIGTIRNEATLFAVVKESVDAALRILPSNAKRLLDEARARADQRNISLTQRIRDLFDAFTADYKDVIGCEDERERLEELREEKEARAKHREGVVNLVKELFADTLRFEETHFNATKAQMRANIGVLAARARILQESVTLDAELEQRFASVFAILNRVSHEQQPGNVPLLARNYRGNFRDDLARYSRELEEAEKGAAAFKVLVARTEEEQKAAAAELARARDSLQEARALADDPYFSEDADKRSTCGRLLRRALTRLPVNDPDLLAVAKPIAARLPDFFSDDVLARLRPHVGLPPLAVATSAPSDEESGPASNEHLRHKFEGQRGLIVGGIPVEQARGKLQEFYGFASLDWTELEGKAPRRIQGLASRIERRNYDIVFLLVQFLGHSMYHAIKGAAEKVNVPVIHVRAGYGVNAFAHALER
ncbi:MAG: hypothetical protein HY719_08375 [Planctomycetes bacterium]|nr:hypothetical protein [Planctomycetota bacterium]